MTEAGLVNGYVMKDIRLSYDKKSDTLAVGVNFYGIAGNTDGSPDGSTNPQDHRRRAGRTRRTSAATSRSPSPSRPSPPPAPTPPRSSSPASPPTRSSSPAGSLDGFNVAAYHSTRPAGIGPELRDDPDQQPRGPGLRPLGGPPRLRVHHQELQQDPRPQRPDQGVLRLGLRRDRDHDHHRQERDLRHPGRRPRSSSRRTCRTRPAGHPADPGRRRAPTSPSPRPSWPGAWSPAARPGGSVAGSAPRSVRDSISRSIHDSSERKAATRTSGRRFLFRPGSTAPERPISPTADDPSPLHASPPDALRPTVRSPRATHRVPATGRLAPDPAIAGPRTLPAAAAVRYRANGRRPLGPRRAPGDRRR